MNQINQDPKDFGQKIAEWRARHIAYRMDEVLAGRAEENDGYVPHTHSFYNDIVKVPHTVVGLSASGTVWERHHREIHMTGDGDWMDRRTAINDVSKICDEFGTTPVFACQEFHAGMRAERRAECIAKWQNRANMVKDFFAEKANSVKSFFVKDHEKGGDM